MECYYFLTESGDGGPEQNVRVNFTTAFEIRTNLTRSAGKLQGGKLFSLNRWRSLQLEERRGCKGKSLFEFRKISPFSSVTDRGERKRDDILYSPKPFSHFASRYFPWTKPTTTYSPSSSRRFTARVCQGRCFKGVLRTVYLCMVSLSSDTL